MLLNLLADMKKFADDPKKFGGSIRDKISDAIPKLNGVYVYQLPNLMWVAEDILTDKRSEEHLTPEGALLELT